MVWLPDGGKKFDAMSIRFAMLFGLEKLEWCGYLMVKKFDAMSISFAMLFGLEKLEWCGYPMVKKICYVYSF